MTQQFLNIGGLVALGFDPTGEFMLTITHSGRGVFRVGTWERVARDIEMAYPDAGFGIGIGPIADLRIPIVSINYDTGELDAQTPDLAYNLHYAEGSVLIQPHDRSHGDD